MYYRKIEDDKRKKKIYRCYKKKHWYFRVSGVYYDEEKQRFVRFWRDKTSKQYKRICNRRFRRTREIYNHGSYKKYTDFWWMLM